MLSKSSCDGTLHAFYGLVQLGYKRLTEVPLLGTIGPTQYNTLHEDLFMMLNDILAVNGQPLRGGALFANDFYEWEQLELTCQPQPNVVAAFLQINETTLGQPTTRLNDPVWRWRWNPQHAVGHFTVRLQLDYADGTTDIKQFTLRIAPRKLDIERYEALLMALQRDAFAVVYALSGGQQGARLRPAHAQRTLIEEYYALIEGHVAEALAVAKLIGVRPHQRLSTNQTEAHLGEITYLDPKVLSEIPGAVLDDVEEDILPDLQAVLRPPDRLQGGPLPRTVPAVRSTSTYDVAEHRVLAHVLHVLQWRVAFVRELARRELRRRQRTAYLADVGASAPAIEVWLRRCSEALKKLRQASAQPWLAGVGRVQSLSGPTHLMRYESRYRRLYELYRGLRTTPFIAFDSPTLWLPVGELPLLYEQWCTLQVVKALLPLGSVVNQHLLEQTGDAAGEQRHWTLRLQHQQPLLVLRLPDGTQLAVWYQRRYQPGAAASRELAALDPFVRIPDIAIEIVPPQASPQVLIFDAKYRSTPDGRVPQDALDDAYAYRGAIGTAGKRATVGSFLLFPGSEPLHTADHVGAVPLLPGSTGQLEVLVQQLLTLACVSAP